MYRAVEGSVRRYRRALLRRSYREGEGKPAKETLARIRWWNETSLGADLGIAGVHSDEVDAAMDWLGARQDAIERTLARRHLSPGWDGVV